MGAKSILKGAFKKLGYRISKDVDVFTEDSSINSMTASLSRLSKIGIHPGCIIDIGAAAGTWTHKAMKYWPKSQYVLIEPLQEQENVLKQLKSQYPSLDYRLAVAGDQPGTVYLNVSEDLDGSGVYGVRSADAREVPVVTIDEITKAKKGPFLIKFDTHGYEVPILKGAAATLANTSALIIEVYGFHISPTCLLFHELTNYLDTLGFRLFDVVDIMRRQADNAFWQADAIYIRKEQALFSNNRYA